jgi:hypothetical protein
MALSKVELASCTVNTTGHADGDVEDAVEKRGEGAGWCATSAVKTGALQLQPGALTPCLGHLGAREAEAQCAKCCARNSASSCSSGASRPPIARADP